MHTVRRWAVASSLSLAVPVAAAAAALPLPPPDTAPARAPRVERLADGVYAVVRGEPPGLINESNSLFVVGDSGVLVVDAQSSLARTRETLAALRRVTTKPVRTLVNTHWHDDHAFGNAVYRDSFPDVEIVGHASAPEAMATTAARFRAELAAGRAGTLDALRGLAAGGRSFAGGPLGDEERASHEAAASLVPDYGHPGTLRPPPPTTLVRDRLVLRRDGRTIELLHLGRGHTAGDLVVHLPAEGIVAAGDLVMWPVTFVGTTSFPPEFAGALDRLRALRPRAIVPGHGPVLRGDSALAHVERVAAVLRAVEAGARAGRARGDSAAGVRAALAADPAYAAARDALVAGSALRRILFDYYVHGPAVQRAWELVDAPAATAPAQDSAAGARARAVTSRTALAPGVLAVVGATVVPMDRDTVLREATVLVRDGRIVAVGPASAVAVPDGARVVDGRGKWLVPGLADMHAHLYADEWVPDSVAPHELGVFLAHGVTTARLMIGTPLHRRMRAAVEAGGLAGPQLWIASPQLAGRDDPNGRLVRTPAEARAAVREVADAGYDLVKLTVEITPEVYDAVVAEAAARGIRVTGHVDARVGVARALAAGQQIEHLDNYLDAVLADSAAGRPSVSDVGAYRAANWATLDHVDDAKVGAIAGATARAGVAVTPTLAFLHGWFAIEQGDSAVRARPDYAHIPPRMRELYEGARERYWRAPPSAARRARWVAVRQRLVRAIVDSGGRIMAGSDAPGGLMGYGWGLHRELEHLVAAGLSPYEALAAATREPAAYLGASADWGTIAPGRRADLVLLDADPLADIRNSARIAAVAVGGRWLERAELARLLEEARQRLNP